MTDILCAFGVCVGSVLLPSFHLLIRILILWLVCFVLGINAKFMGVADTVTQRARSLAWRPRWFVAPKTISRKYAGMEAFEQK